MAEVYQATLLIDGLSPDDCYIKAMDIAPKVMPGFKVWKKRPTARLFGLQNNDDEFSTINFFMVAKENGTEIEIRFNTKKLSIEELKSFTVAFQDAMRKV